ncbi:MAG: leucine-rich repeat protein [Muribaculaceae bacterium]|nr:leucine-rich repeat protein [Muribaculaceae bacterium]
MRYYNYSPLLTLALICYGCSDYTDLRNGQDSGSGKEIYISGRIEQEYVTRADDNGFADGDAIGVYIVDYDGNAPSDLKSRENHADNIKFVYSEADADWNGSAKIYWTDDNTPVDAYGYYPFAEYMEDVKNYNFTISKDQGDVDKVSGLTGYEASDFLWAKASGVQPGKKIELLHNHMMASVIVTLVEGDGFDGEWNDLEKDVTIDNTIANTLIDLSTGKISVLENAGIAKIHPYNVGNDYRAIVAPQSVDAGKTLVTISIGADSYQFMRNSEMKYSPSKLHRFVIKVDKKPEGDYAFTLVNEDITPWENDAVGHNASTKAYTVIDCPEPGSFESVIKEAGIKTQSIEYLKLTGTMNQEDFNFFNNNFRGLLSLNMKELRTTGIHLTDGYYAQVNRDLPGWGIFNDGRIITEEDTFDDALPVHMLSEWFFGGNDASHATRLSHIDLPDNCKYIGVAALSHLPLTGTLTIPEGVKWIGDGCIGCYASDSHHISSLVLPTTLEYIGSEAFNGCEFTNELLLPDNLKYIGNNAFSNCCNTSGEARIPSGIRYLGDYAFSGTPLTGTVVFPAGMKRIPNSFNNTKVTGVYIPDGAEEIADCAFGGVGYGSQFDVYGSEVRGDIYLPNSIKKIGKGAFAGSKINHINIPTSLEVIPRDMLNGCIYLTDSIVIPENVRRINQGAFLNCKNLKYIRIPSGVEVIGGDDSDMAWWTDATFAGCYSLEELRCDAVEPPSLINDPFSGFNEQIHKDNFTLVVPEKSIALYQNAQWWKEFKRISAYHNLVFRPQIAKVLNKGGSRDVVLNADAGKQWKVTECPDWLHISSTSGVGKSTMTISIDEMAHGSADRRGEIKVQLEGTNFTTSFSVAQFDYEYDEDQSFTLQEHTLGKQGVNIVIVGDGYDAEDIANGTYLDDMQQATERFFDLEPFKTYRGYFNVYTAFAMSYESGIGSVNYLRNPKFSTTFGNMSYDSRITCASDYVACYCLDNTPIKEEDFDTLTCILVANSNAYDGLTYMFDNGTSVSICPKSECDYPNDWRGLIQHEAAGHAFTKLADEYIYHNHSIVGCTCVCCGHIPNLKGMHVKGWGLNLSTSSKNADVHWRHMLSDRRVNDIVDIWEGGYFHARGVYRSEYNSVMNNNVPYMSTWCRELAVRRIMDYAGETFNYEDFLAKDSRDWGRDFTLGSRASATQSLLKTSVQNSAPIIINSSPRRDFKGVRANSYKH